MDFAYRTMPVMGIKSHSHNRPLGEEYQQLLMDDFKVSNAILGSHNNVSKMGESLLRTVAVFSLKLYSPCAQREHSLRMRKFVIISHSDKGS